MNNWQIPESSGFNYYSIVWLRLPRIVELELSAKIPILENYCQWTVLGKNTTIEPKYQPHISMQYLGDSFTVNSKQAKNYAQSLSDRKLLPPVEILVDGIDFWRGTTIAGRQVTKINWKLSSDTKQSLTHIHGVLQDNLFSDVMSQYQNQNFLPHLTIGEMKPQYQSQSLQSLSKTVNFDFWKKFIATDWQVSFYDGNTHLVFSVY